MGAGLEPRRFLGQVVDQFVVKVDRLALDLGQVQPDKIGMVVHCFFGLDLRVLVLEWAKLPHVVSSGPDGHRVFFFRLRKVTIRV